MLTNARILVVDDEEMIVDMLRELLEFAGAAVYTAKSSAEAIGLVKKENFDLIISDIFMPGGDGLRLIESIKSQAKMRPRLALLSGRADLEEKDTSIFGVDAIFKKPFIVNDFLTELEKLIRSAVSN